MIDMVVEALLFDRTKVGLDLLEGLYLGQATA